MNRAFTPDEDAMILKNPKVGAWRLARMLGRAYQSCRDRREKLFGGEPPRIYAPARRRRRKSDAGQAL
jgi:hypothetical protein